MRMGYHGGKFRVSELVAAFLQAFCLLFRSYVDCSCGGTAMMMKRSNPKRVAPAIFPSMRLR
jgi:hypothetical protein